MVSATYFYITICIDLGRTIRENILLRKGCIDCDSTTIQKGDLQIMEAIECIKTRRSVRKFTDEIISKELITEIIDIAKMAPSWKNTQTVRYMAIQDKSIIDKLASDCVLNFEYNQKTLSRCNNVMLILQKNNICGFERDGSYSTSKEDKWEMFDAGIATQTFCLAAHEKGIGTVILGIFDEEAIKNVVGIPEGMSVAAVVPFGVPAFAPDPTPRKETEVLLTFK